LRRAAPRRHPACGHLANRHPANQIIFFLDGRATNIAARRRLLETRSPSLKQRRSVIDRISLNCLPRLYEGQEATVLQLPVETHTAAEAKKREPCSITAYTGDDRDQVPVSAHEVTASLLETPDFEHVLVNSAAVLTKYPFRLLA
jgi:hypothetical protein